MSAKKIPGKFPSFTTSNPDLEQGIPPPSRLPTLGRRRSSFNLRELDNQSFIDLEKGPGTPIRATSPIRRYEKSPSAPSTPKSRPIPPTQTPIKYPPESPLHPRKTGTFHASLTPGTQFTPNDMIITMLLKKKKKKNIPNYEKKLQTDPVFLIQEVENFLTRFHSIPPSQGLEQQVMTALEYYNKNIGQLPPLAKEELRKYLDPENKKLFPMKAGKSRKRNGKKSKNRKKSRKGKKSKTKKSKTKKSKKSRKN